MKRIVKIFAVVLALAFAALSFAACQKESSGGKSSKKEETEVSGYSSAEECAKSVVKYKFNANYQKLYESFPGDFTERHMKNNGYSRSDLKSAMKEAEAVWNEYVERNNCRHEKTEILSEDPVEDYEIEWINDYYGINAEEAKYVMVAVTYSWGDGSYTDNYSGYAVKIGGRWYLSPESFNELFFNEVDDHLNYSGYDDVGTPGDDF